MIRTARWRKRLRESSASLFILVQIQAGSPAFAGSASFGQASPVVAKAVPAEALAKADWRGQAIIVENTPSIMDGCAVDIGQPPETAAESDLGEIPCVRSRAPAEKPTQAPCLTQTSKRHRGKSRLGSTPRPCLPALRSRMLRAASANGGVPPTSAGPAD